MRIALCSHEVEGVRGGGIGTYVVEAGKALTAAGHEVWLVTSAPEPERAEALRRREGFARVLFVEDAKTERHEVRFGLARHALWFAQLAVDVLRESGERFDYVEFPDYGALGAVAVPEQRFFGTFGDAVVAVVLHSPTHECWQWNEQLHVLPPSEREVSVLEHETIQKAPVVWSPSTRLAEMVADRLALPRDFASVIRYPMALPADAPPPPRPRTALEDLKFLYFGRIEPRKGVRQLAAAFAQLPGLSIECIGRDGNTSPLQTSEVAWLRRRGAANVTFVPPLPRDELRRRIRAADVVVLPSTWDNWPNACLEAMAEARVVIGGKNGGMAEMIVHGESGFLVDGSSPDDLVRVIREDLTAALPRLDAIGRNAASRIRELSEPRRYVAAIEDLVRRHRGRGRLPAQPATQSAARRLVSVVVPFYKEEPNIIGEAVDSALRQTHRELEVLVVNDGSPRPDAETILAGLAEKDPRVRVLHKPNGGLASARNHAIAEAKGDFVLCCDGDNVLRPEYAATGLEVFERAADVMAVAPRLALFDERTGDRVCVIQGLPYDRPLAVFRNSLGDAGAMFRTAVFREHGLRYDSDVDVYSDWALWLDMARAGLCIQVVPRVLYDYRVRGDSLMGEHAFERHLAMLGLLIARHLPPGDPSSDGRDERELLVNLAQGWGVGAIASALGGRPEYWEDPVGTARRLRKDAMRYRLADALGKVADRVPPVRRLAHAVLAQLFRWHGKWKDRRRGGRPV
jgi:glycosyltransferase involved in cell wall biosynthesis